ncbi:MAG TPA: branched-chain amino acid ABC transporter permease [Casimicrobiaceae bacterium]|nr:branched-chain amino acid ABC transporter permease [Casimicrobiaceae bacterium]
MATPSVPVVSTSKPLARRDALPSDRFRPLEIVFWLIPIACFFAFPSYRLLGSQVLIIGLFAVSLDLVLGYAGIVSLGHAAFFGVGAYTAGLLAVHGFHEPISGLFVAAVAAAIVGYLVSFLVVRGGDLTRLMVTLGIGLMLWEVANKAAFITGGVDGLSGVTIAPILGRFSFDIGGRTAYVYALVVVFLVFVVLRRIVHSPFGLSVRGIREGGRRMPAIGAPVARRLRAMFTLGAAVAGIAGALIAQTTQFVGIDTLGFPRSADLMIMLILGGTGRLYGGLVGAAIFIVAQDYLSGIDPVYWQFWIGFFLVVIVLFARGGILGGLEALRERIQRRSK